MAVERRALAGTTLRAASNGKNKTITGYAACFGVLSEPIGGGRGFREQIAKDAFNAWLASTDCDVRCLKNHDPSAVLGRQKSGTLSLKVDASGLQYTCVLPRTATADDLYESIKRGDITGSSFGFEVVQDDWNDEDNIRTLKRVNLFDVSPVTFPAYPQATVQVRSASGRMETVQLGTYRSRSLRAPALPMTAASMKARARALESELGLRSTRGDDEDCECECGPCQEGDCGACDCTGCDASCENQDCSCAEHRSRRLHSFTGRTVYPPGSDLCEFVANRDLESRIFDARRKMRAMRINAR